MNKIEIYNEDCINGMRKMGGASRFNPYRSSI